MHNSGVNLATREFMTIEQTLLERSEGKCELCTSDNQLSVYEIPPEEVNSDKCAMLCTSCKEQILAESNKLDPNHWRCLNDSMWSPTPAIQVIAWRQLNHLSQHGESWAQDLLDIMYLEDEVKEWAETAVADNSIEHTLDFNGVPLTSGDTVTLVKDLDVKGANFTAKRGTAVRNISLSNNPLHIEGRVNGSRIVIIAAYVKKSN